MGEAYPELLQQSAEISRIIKKEEEQFARTLDKGMGVLEMALADLSGSELPGKLVFQLYDTYGFPTDLTNDIARERGYSLDMEGYETCMEEQRTRARASSQFSIDYTNTIRLEGSTDFCGYAVTELSSEIIGLYSSGEAVDSVSEGTDVALILAQTAFYAESGGQIGDKGLLTKGKSVIAISDCRKVGNHHLHIGQVVSGQFNIADQVNGSVDETQRRGVTLNHSATHLLHEALRQVLGEHVHQKGSLVNHERLRFDFSHGEAVTPEQIRRIEHIVNAQVLKNTEVTTDVMSMEDAKAKGALRRAKAGQSVQIFDIKVKNPNNPSYQFKKVSPVICEIVN